MQRLTPSIKLFFLAVYALSRDGGTGRRSGLKIRRASALGGSIPLPASTLETAWDAGPERSDLQRITVIDHIEIALVTAL